MTDLQEAVDRVTELRASRDAARSSCEGETLVAPGCERGCDPCPRTCAVATIMLNWWEAELCRLRPGVVVPFSTAARRTVH